MRRSETAAARRFDVTALSTFYLCGGALAVSAGLWALVLAALNV